MWRAMKLFVAALLVLGFVWFGRTVELGKHTLFDHLARIWRSDETQDLVDGTRKKAKPAIERVKRGVAAGVKEVSEDP